MTVSGSAIYAHSIARTRQKVRPGVKVAETPTFEPKPVGPALRWFGLACLGLFMVVLGVIAGARLVTGHPVSQVFSNDTPSTTTTITTHPTQTVSEIVVPTTVTVTSTATTTATASPTDSASTPPTPTPSPTGTVGVTPSATPTSP